MIIRLNLVAESREMKASGAIATNFSKFVSCGSKSIVTVQINC